MSRNFEKEVHYVGRTKNVDSRAKAHQQPNEKHPMRHTYTMIVVLTGLSYVEARAWEQALISFFTLDALENARREIAVKNVTAATAEIIRGSEILAGYYETDITDLLIK